MSVDEKKLVDVFSAGQPKLIRADDGSLAVVFGGEGPLNIKVPFTQKVGNGAYILNPAVSFYMASTVPAYIINHLNQEPNISLPDNENCTSSGIDGHRA